MRKLWLGVIVIALVILAIVLLVPQTKQEPKEIRIGVILPLTGDIASYGERVKNGAEVALAEVRENKEFIPITIEWQDDQNNAMSAVNIMKTFCTVKRYPVVIGAAGSSVSLAIAPIANQYQIVQISPLSSAASLTTEGGDYFFRICPADDQQAKALASWVAEKNYKKIAVVYTNNAWGQGLADAFSKYFSPLGKGEIVAVEATIEGHTDFRTSLTKIKELGVEAIVSPTYPKEGGSLVRQTKELGLKVDLYGADNWGAPEFIQIAGNAAEGCLFVSQYSYTGPEFQKLDTKYRQAYGKPADVFVAYGYDVVYAIAYATEKAKTLTGPDIRASLLNVSFQGASGLIEFDKYGDLKTNAFVRKVIRNGKVVAY